MNVLKSRALTNAIENKVSKSKAALIFPRHSHMLYQKTFVGTKDKRLMSRRTPSPHSNMEVEQSCYGGSLLLQEVVIVNYL